MTTTNLLIKEINKKNFLPEVIKQKSEPTSLGKNNIEIINKNLKQKINLESDEYKSYQTAALHNIDTLINNIFKLEESNLFTSKSIKENINKYKLLKDQIQKIYAIEHLKKIIISVKEENKKLTAKLTLIKTKIEDHINYQNKAVLSIENAIKLLLSNSNISTDIINVLVKYRILKEEIIFKKKVYSTEQLKQLIYHIEKERALFMLNKVDSLTNITKDILDDIVELKILKDELLKDSYSTELVEIPTSDIEKKLNQINQKVEKIEAEKKEKEKIQAEEDRRKEARKIFEENTINLTEEAKKGKFNHIIPRKDILDEITTIINDKDHPLLIAKAGTGKSQSIKSFARETLKDNIVIYELRTNAILANTSYRGELEQKLKAVFDYLTFLNQEGKTKGKVYLFCDEIHSFLTIGKNQDSAVDIGNLIKPYLDDKAFILIGATTKIEYDKYIAPDSALSRRFIEVDLDGFDDKTLCELLYKEKIKLEEKTGIKPRMTDEACLAIGMLYKIFLCKPEVHPLAGSIKFLKKIHAKANKSVVDLDEICKFVLKEYNENYRNEHRIELSDLNKATQAVASNMYSQKQTAGYSKTTSYDARNKITGTSESHNYHYKNLGDLTANHIEAHRDYNKYKNAIEAHNECLKSPLTINEIKETYQKTHLTLSSEDLNKDLHNCPQKLFSSLVSKSFAKTFTNKVNAEVFHLSPRLAYLLCMHTNFFAEDLFDKPFSLKELMQNSFYDKESKNYLGDWIIQNMHKKGDEIIDQTEYMNRLFNRFFTKVESSLENYCSQKRPECKIFYRKCQTEISDLKSVLKNSLSMKNLYFKIPTGEKIEPGDLKKFKEVLYKDEKRITFFNQKLTRDSYSNNSNGDLNIQIDNFKRFEKFSNKIAPNQFENNSKFYQNYNYANKSKSVFRSIGETMLTVLSLAFN